MDAGRSDTAAGEPVTLPMLSPTSNPRYLATVRRGMDRFPERRQNLDRMSAARRAAVVEHLPAPLCIEILGRCNFRCVMCDLQGLPGRSRGADVPLEDLLRFVDQMPWLHEVRLPGVGEGFLHEGLIPLVQHMVERDIWVHVTSNGSLLDHNENGRRLIEAGVGELALSVDGGTREVFESIRPGAVFDQLVARFTRVNTYGRAAEVTRAYTTVQRGNRHQLEAILDLSARCGFPRHTFEFGLFDWGNPRLQERIRGLREFAPLERKEAWALVEHGRRLGVDVTFVLFERLFTRGRNICPHPFERTFVGTGWRLGPCCRLGPKARDLGDARDLASAWNGAPYREFREAHLRGAPPPECAACYRSAAVAASSAP